MLKTFYRAFFNQFRFAVFVLLICSFSALAQTNANFDVLHYNAEIEPDFAAKSVKGRVFIRFAALQNDLDGIEIDVGDLTINAVRDLKGVGQKFTRAEKRLKIALASSLKTGEVREIEIAFQGAPRFGIRFFPERLQVYTVFSTSQWMPCVDDPSDRASFHLKLTLPAGVEAVGNGTFVSKDAVAKNKTVFEFQQTAPVPTYVFGFAAGRFRKVEEKVGQLKLQYFAENFTDAELKRIFRDTADMIEFFETRSGVKYEGDVYAQVLAAGGVEQEMSGFTAMRETYGGDVLKDEKDVWLGAHELAHQWWGNMVTNRDWTHFWLNEGIATFMTAAYKEHRFGCEEYMREITASRERYEKVRDAGKDKSLVFPNWKQPTREDRTLVYQKGAYVMHLLREEMGDEAFWKALRFYTREFWGKPVTTAEFQAAMEKSSGKNLAPFFNKWVYLKVQ